MNSMENLTSFNGYSLDDRYPIHRACRDGDVSKLDALLTEGPEKLRALFCEDSFCGWTPVHFAAYHGHLACIRKLLMLANASSALGQQHGYGNEAGTGQIWNTLIDSQASNFRQTPIHLSAYGNHVECLKWLLDAGASPHITDALNETAVHKAARCGSFECLSLLIAHNIDLSIVNNAGQTAADLAAMCGHVRCSAYLRYQFGSNNDSMTNDTTATAMDIDQNGHQLALVSGAYGYQPFLSKMMVNGRKRNLRDDVGMTDVQKKCKKSWNKDSIANGAHQQQLNQNACAMTSGRSWMSSHCLM